MTQAVDPFAQADGSVSINPNVGPAGDPFGQPAGGGDFPKPLELNGALLLLTPVKVEVVPDKFAKDAGATTKRLSADTVVLTGLRKGESFDAMYWSQKPIVAAAESAQRKGVPSILGTLRRVPIGQAKKDGNYSTPDGGTDYAAFEAAIEAWRMGDAPIQFAWILEKFTDGEAQIARDYLASTSK